MSYLELLHLSREPFSNSPDPEAYCRTPTHEACLNRLEIAVRLRRGLNVVLGEVGTGKSTLCRYLLRTLSNQDDLEVFVLMDAGFDDAESFVAHLYSLFTGKTPPEGSSRREIIGLIQDFVFDRALDARHNLVLLVDEGQKMGPAALEVLRELLNFETNTEKLLQIVIFGQPELAKTIEELPNFKDRINEYLFLQPLSKKESIDLLRYRLHLAGGQAAERLFSESGFAALHEVSKGKPRQLMRLGHQMLISLLISDRRIVTREMVLAQAARNEGRAVSPSRRWWLVAALALLLLAGLLAFPAIREPAWDQVRRLWVSEISVGENSGGKKNVPETSGVGEARGDSPLGGGVSAGSVLSEKPAVPVLDAAPLPSSEGSLGATSDATGAQDNVPAGETVPLLGTFTLEAGMDPARVVHEIYGPSQKAEQAVQDLNPGYMPGTPFPGLVLQLPLLLFAPPSNLTGGYLVSIGSYATPEEAYKRLLKHRSKSIMVDLVPLREEGGYRFHLLSRRPFWSPKQAWAWVSRNAPDSDSRIQIISAFKPTEKVTRVFE